MVLLTLLGYIIVSVLLILIAPRTTLAAVVIAYAHKLGFTAAIFGVKAGFFVYMFGGGLAILAMLLTILLAISLDIRNFKPSFAYLLRK